MTDSYAYRSLSTYDKEIRVLYLNSRPTPGKPLNYRVQHVSITALPRPVFNAISYTWGEPSDTVDVVLDHQICRIPRCAESALRGTSSVAHQHVPSEVLVPVWIDAVCINQDDEHEKSRQLALMESVYTRAYTVMVWLGEEHGDDTAAAFRSIKMFELHIQTPDAHGFKDLEKCLWLDHQAGDDTIRYLRLSDLPSPPQSVDWHALIRLYSRPWFRRLWCLQEIALSQRARCYRGNAFMDFEPIALLGRWMLSSFTWPAALDSAGMRDARQGLNNAGDIWNCWRGGLEIKLVDLLTITYGFETRHPADRILALLGLWRRNDYNARRWLRAGESWGGVAPENAQHSIRTYANGIREAVTEGSSGLEILCMVELGKKRAHSADKLMIYPSWLPTLGAQPSVHALKIRRKWANASGNTWPVVHLDTPWNVLGVDGFLISEIVCSFDLADADSSGSDGEVHCSSIPMERESFRTVKLDVFADILTDRPQGRCVWKTSSRQGYAKSGVRAGDMLCILFGCWAPVILRQDGEGWIFVALALAEDLMDGRVVQQLIAQQQLEHRIVTFMIH